MLLSHLVISALHIKFELLPLWNLRKSQGKLSLDKGLRLFLRRDKYFNDAWIWRGHWLIDRGLTKKRPCYFLESWLLSWAKARVGTMLVRGCSFSRRRHGLIVSWRLHCCALVILNSLLSDALRLWRIVVSDHGSDLVVHWQTKHGCVW